MSAPEGPKKKRGCFFYGCIISLVLLVLIAVGGILLFRTGVNWMNGQIAEYTDNSPMPLPHVDISAEDYGKLKERVAAFQKALAAHTNAESLVLSSRDLNALIANAPEARQFKDKIYLELEGSQVKGQVSLPCEELAKSRLIKSKGRFLNGSGVFSVGKTNSVTEIMVLSFEAKGKPLPPTLLGLLQLYTLQQTTLQPSNAVAFAQFESLEVKDSTLIIKAKGN